jgi:hypothetical protein
MHANMEASAARLAAVAGAAQRPDVRSSRD